MGMAALLRVPAWQGCHSKVNKANACVTCRLELSLALLEAALEEGIVDLHLITWTHNDDKAPTEPALPAAEHQPLWQRLSASAVLGYLFCLALFALGFFISYKLVPSTPLNGL
jgi:hypothetical protein